MTLNKFMYTLFLGLFLMKEDIPEHVLDYVHKYGPETESITVSLWVILSTLRGASDLKDEYLRSIVIETLE